MRGSASPFATAVVATLAATGGCWMSAGLGGAAPQADADTSTDSDHDTGTGTGADTDSDAAAAGCAAGGNWYDPATGLCWQDPPSDGDLDWPAALAYCDSLTAGGYEDWRLPRIQELISLLRGCVDGVATGDLSASGCNVSDPGCLGYGCIEGTACDPCEEAAAPGGCYRVPELHGECTRHWSSSPYAGGTGSAWGVKFFEGVAKTFAPGYDVNISARCVRSQ